MSQHYVGFGANVQSPMHIDNLPQTSTRFGLGGGAEFAYEYRHGNFLLNLGVGAEYVSSRQRVDDEHLQVSMTDTRGINFTYNGSLQKRTDVIRVVNIPLSLRLGFEAGQFYLLAGATYALRVGGSSLQQAELATEGDYNGRYYVPLTDMPNHGYHDYEHTSTSGEIARLNDLRLHLEVGTDRQMLRSGRKVKPVLRIGVFAEYGLLNLIDNPTDRQITELDVQQYMQVRLNNVYYSTLARGGKANSFTAGVKVTVLMGVGGTSKRFRKSKCHCYWL
ncbi:MAG: hypothetical protein IJ680_06955 [Paludibacteraceae bacterium]|nr:hypothetical protein [Paludibacteraceae bacterium]